MNELQIHEKLRMQDVKRWVIVSTQRQQSVAEHTMSAILIAQELCKRIQIQDTTLINAIIEHDFYEIRTGDIPTPAKRQMNQLGFDYSDLEGPLPFVESLTDVEYNLFKCIDLMEAIYFLHNYGAGKRAETITDALYDELVNKAEWFITRDQPLGTYHVHVIGMMTEIMNDCGEL